MDEIIVLDAGRITARGTFAELSGTAGPLHALISLIDEPVAIAV